MRREHLQNSDVNRSYEPHRTGAQTALSASSLDSIRADMAVRAPIGGLWILLLQAIELVARGCGRQVERRGAGDARLQFRPVVRAAGQRRGLLQCRGAGGDRDAEVSLSPAYRHAGELQLRRGGDIVICLDGIRIGAVVDGNLCVVRAVSEGLEVAVAG